MIDLKNLIMKMLPDCPYTFSVKKIDGIFVHTYISDELCEFVGIDRKEIIDHSLYDFLPKSNYTDNKLRAYKKAWSGETQIMLCEPADIENYLLKVKPVYKNGTIVEIYGECYPIPTKIFAVA